MQTLAFSTLVLSLMELEVESQFYGWEMLGWIKVLEIREVTRFCKEHFSEDVWERPRLDDITFPVLSQEVSAPLSQPFSLDEVDKVVAN